VHARKGAAGEEQTGEVAALLTAAVSEADGHLPPGPPAG
jgi:hypothetical protein